MNQHLIGFVAGFILDQLIGDPHFSFHPVIFMGKLINSLDKALLKKRKSESYEFWLGALLVMIVLAVTAMITALISYFCSRISPYAVIVYEAVATYFILASRSLMDESMKVYRCLVADDIEGARHAVSMIVGRDTAVLDRAGIIRAAVETVAENASDGVIAPMLYIAVFGPVGGFLYKAINTMDSMIGYKNDRYRYFGTVAARLDDIVNFIPARISALLMIAAAFICQIFDGRHFSGSSSVRIFLRDRRNHKSPNSAMTESVAAGALSVRLAGDASYFGKVVKKPFIGDAIREIEAEDIKRVNLLMQLGTYICVVIIIVIYCSAQTVPFIQDIPMIWRRG